MKGLGIIFEERYFKKYGVWPVTFDPRSFSDWLSYEKIANKYFNKEGRNEEKPNEEGN